MTEMVSATLNGRWTLTLPKHRAERPDWHDEAGWEKARLEALHDCITGQDAPTIYYVGAELGEMPALCQLWGADVVLFEPNPKAWPSIKMIWRANGLEDPITFPGFASNVTSILNAHPARGFPDCADVELEEAHGFKELHLEADNYPQVRLDDVAGWFTPPTIISFDVEGSEWQVLRGAEGILREHRPTLFASIHPEFMFHQWGEYSADFRGWIKAFGYRETILAYEHELHCLYVPERA